MPEAISFKLCGHGWCVQAGVILLLGFGWRYVAYGLQKTAVVEPIDPFECGELHSFEVAPWSSPMDDLCLVKTVDRFSESIVIAVANSSDGGLDARLRQSLGIANGHVLHTPIGMVDEPTAMDGPPIMKRLVQGIEDEARMGVRLARQPTMRRAKASMTKAT